MSYRPSLLGLALVVGATAIVVAPPARAGQATVFVNFGGFDFCEVCGAVDYATAGNGMEDRVFPDPLPAGAVPTQVIANVQGTCDDTVGITIDGTFVGSSAFVGVGCDCGTCFDGSLATSAIYPDGFPGWSFGGAQSIHVDAVVIALDGVDVTVVYRICGDGVPEGPEVCDTGGDSGACDADCTAVVCGDGRVNGAAGEACDTVGDTAACDDDCSGVFCGDGHVNAAAGEICDTVVENAACDDDCTLAACGDGHVNGAAGETCDDGDLDDGDGCSSVCQNETGPSASSTGAGPAAGGAGPGASSGGFGGNGGASGGDGGADASAGSTAAAGPTGPTASGIAVAAGSGSGGRAVAADDGGDGDDDGASEGGASPDGVEGSSSGCGCAVPAPSQAPTGGLAALAVAFAAALVRRSRRRATPRTFR